MNIEWLKDERLVPALKRIVKKGDTFDAPDSIALDLISQGVAKKVTPAAPPAKKGAPADPLD